MTMNPDLLIGARVERIISIHKKGDASNPENHRGITLTSCLGKLFNSVLNNRLC